jgi:hypothetical protein
MPDKHTQVYTITVCKPTFLHSISYRICRYVYHLCTKFHIPVANVLLIITAKLKATRNH